jgi:hypothetical protein
LEDDSLCPLYDKEALWIIRFRTYPTFSGYFWTLNPCFYKSPKRQFMEHYRAKLRCDNLFYGRPDHRVRIPTVKDLRKRLKNDHFSAGLPISFLWSASFGVIVLPVGTKIRKLQRHWRGEKSTTPPSHSRRFCWWWCCGYRYHTLQIERPCQIRGENPKPEPKKHGRKTRAEKEAYNKQKQEQEAEQTLFEESIAALLEVS